MSDLRKGDAVRLFLWQLRVFFAGKSASWYGMMRYGAVPQLCVYCNRMTPVYARECCNSGRTCDDGGGCCGGSTCIWCRRTADEGDWIIRFEYADGCHMLIRRDGSESSGGPRHAPHLSFVPNDKPVRTLYARNITPHSTAPVGSWKPEPQPVRYADWPQVYWWLFHELADAAITQERSVDVAGECNARWSINRCTREPNHPPPHGIALGGMILAPWTD